ncbi:MAG: PKD domain-containing protein, partial [Bacteroidia bacterium]
MLIAENACGKDTSTDYFILTPNSIRAGFNPQFGYSNSCTLTPIPIINKTTGANIFEWNFGDGTPTQFTFTSPDTIFHTFGRTGTFIVRLKASNSCSDTTLYDTVRISTPSRPNFSINKTKICPGDSLFAQNSSSNYSSFYWKVNGVNSGNSSTLPFSLSQSGLIPVTIVTTKVHPNALICVDSFTRLIQVDTAPQARIVSNYASQCNPLSIIFKDSSTNHQPLLSIWNFGDSTTSFGDSVTHTYSKNGSYLAYLVAFSNQGCSDTSFLSIQIKEKPIAKFATSLKDSCTGLQVQFFNQTIYSGAPVTIQYEWAVDSAISGNFQVKSTSKNWTNSFNIPPTSTSTVPFRIRLIARTQLGCTDTIYDTVTIHPSPKATYSHRFNSQVCLPFTVHDSLITYSSSLPKNQKYQCFLNGSAISTFDTTPRLPTTTLTQFDST